LRVRRVFGDVLRVDQRFTLIYRLPAEGVRILFKLSREGRSAGGDKDLRHLLAVQVVANRGLRLGAQPRIHQEHLVLLDQLLGQRQGLRWVVGVVQVFVADLPAVHAALVVDVVEVGVRGLGDRAVCRGWTAQRIGATEQDGVLGNADVARGERGRGRRRRRGRGCGGLGGGRGGRRRGWRRRGRSRGRRARGRRRCGCPTRAGD